MKKILAAILLFLPGFVFAQSATQRPGEDCGVNSVLCNPIQTNVTSLPEFLKYAMQYAGTLLGLLAIAMLVYAGIRMVTANGNDKTITEAKQTLQYTVIGFILSVLAFAGVLAIENFIGVRTTRNPGSVVFNPFGGMTLKGFFENLLRNVIGISGLIAVAVLIWNGFRYMSARGDDKQVSSAKSAIYWSLLGLIIILFAYVIISAIAKLIS